MMDERDLVFHGAAIKRHAGAAAIAELIGLPEARVSAQLAAAVATGRAIEAKGAFALGPLTRVALEARYGLHFGGLREDAAFVSAYEAFERINRTLKQVITDWQTITIGGAKVANDHSDAAHDDAVIDRLGDVHEQVEPILAALAKGLPRLAIYSQKLLAALESAEDGDHEWVSDIRRESYHTMWFELHEDLLRIMGQVREE
ncbi:hypothetical protein [Sphingobium boeckii]|uniref:Uncharacterized protein n=1 Tax=Sphingobium boeckii TaxID=1082345 RepID=A0A7W9AHV4_9SPHN|nr:hypothetical protein [Sphingobium boeckii]MBB5685890.1 hypothetical protein [Sphingobium boeckii]